MPAISQVANEVHDEFNAALFLEIFVFGYILLIIMLPLKGKNQFTLLLTVLRTEL